MAPAHAVRSRTKVLLASSVWEDGRYIIIIRSIGKKKYNFFFWGGGGFLDVLRPYMVLLVGNNLIIPGQGEFG